jgi:hypothetical protein
MSDRVYLGDAVYVELENGMLKLMTSNGIGITNTIFLERDVYLALVRYVDSLDAKPRTFTKEEIVRAFPFKPE